MARIGALVPDLLFGSRVQAMLQTAGHEVDLLPIAVPDGDYDLLVVDLTADDVDPVALAGTGMPTLGFYAHVQPEIRDGAMSAGFDLVVPRSRMNREGAALADGLLSRR